MNKFYFFTFIFIVLINKLTFSQNLNDSLIAHYCFDGNANDNFGTNHCTVFGATLTTDRFNNPNSAYYFDGISNYIQMPIKTWIPNDFSVTGWVKEDTLKYFERFFEFGNGINAQNVFYSFTTTNSFSSFTIHDCSNGGVYQRIQPTSVIPIGVWKHISITFNNTTDTGKIYLDGVLWAQGKFTPQTCGGLKTQNYFGKSDFSSNPDELFRGKMDDIRIYHRELNANEIVQVYNLTSCSNVIQPPSHPVANFNSNFPNICDSLLKQFTDLSSDSNGVITNWNWNFGDPISGANNISNLQNPQHIFSTSGTYNVTLIITDNNNISDTISTNVIVSTSNFSIDAGLSKTICNGDTTQLQATPGYNYNWTPSNSISNSTISNPQAFPNSTTTYTVIATDNNGCTATDNVVITVNNALPITILPDTILCEGNNTTLTASGGNNYSWQPISGLNTYSGSVVNCSVNSTTTYTISYVDPNGCKGSQSHTVTVMPYPNLNVTKSNDIECGINYCQLIASGATNYSWYPSTNLSNSLIPNPIASPLNTTSYFVVGSNANCFKIDSITVDVNASIERSLFIPNSFSPNNDDLNDCFKILYTSTIDIKEFEMKIFNRWGEMAYETNNPLDCWNGNLKKSVTAAPIDTYYYYLKLKTNCGNIFKKGDIILIR